MVLDLMAEALIHGKKFCVDLEGDAWMREAEQVEIRGRDDETLPGQGSRGGAFWEHWPWIRACSVRSPNHRNCQGVRECGGFHFEGDAEPGLGHKGGGCQSGPSSCHPLRSWPLGCCAECFTLAVVVGLILQGRAHGHPPVKDEVLAGQAQHTFEDARGKGKDKKGKDHGRGPGRVEKEKSG